MTSLFMKFVTYVSWFYIFTILLGLVVCVFVYFCCSQSQPLHALQRYLPTFLTAQYHTGTMAEKTGAFLEEQPYRLKLKSTLEMRFRLPHGTSKLLDHLYIGSEQDATNLRLLRDLKITHIVNCAEGYCHTGTSYYGNKVKYLGFEAEDDPAYNMMQHFDRAYEFIEDACKRGGKVLIHCLMGINRSGVLAVAYIMKQKHIGPITAAVMAKKQRGLILTNDGFQSQLIHYANQSGLLELDKNEL